MEKLAVGAQKVKFPYGFPVHCSGLCLFFLKFLLVFLYFYQDYMVFWPLNSSFSVQSSNLKCPCSLSNKNVFSRDYETSDNLLLWSQIFVDFNFYLTQLELKDPICVNNYFWVIQYNNCKSRLLPKKYDNYVHFKFNYLILDI